MKDGPKWVLDLSFLSQSQLIDSNKQGRTSKSNVGFGFDLDDDDNEESPEFTFQRQIGRNKENRVKSSLAREK